MRLMLVLLVAAAPGGWLGLRIVRAWKQEQEVLALRRIDGCQVAYDGEDVFVVKFFDKPPPLPPVTWTEALLGKDFVHRAGTVGLPANRVDEVMPHLERLPYLRRVVVLKTDGSPEKEVEVAAKRIENTMPGVETVMLEFDFNIKANVAPDGE